jgi:hypothetical protein
MLTTVVLAQAPPDLSQATHAQKGDSSALSMLGPAMIFFIGLGLLALMLLLSSGSKRKPGPPRPPGW